MSKSPLPLIMVFLLLFFSCSGYRFASDIKESDLQHHVDYLASDALMGRYPGSEGDQETGDYLKTQFRKMGLNPVEQDFGFLKSVKKGPDNVLQINGEDASADAFVPMPFSRNAVVDAPVVFAGYGMTIKTDSFMWNDYENLDIKGKWVMVLRGSPDIPKGQHYLDLNSDDRDKAMLASDNGAAGLLLVSGCRTEKNDRLEEVNGRTSPVNIPVMNITRLLANRILSSKQNIERIESEIDSLQHPVGFHTDVKVHARTDVDTVMGQTRNWYAVSEGSDSLLKKEYIIIGAHDDHLGMGGPGSSSRRPDTLAVHNGADDNASGVAAMLELAAKLSKDEKYCKRSLVFVAFGAEEMGLLGSRYFTQHPPFSISECTAMINLDMVGRFDSTRGIQIGGVGTSIEADSLIQRVNTSYKFKLVMSKDGNGPSDHASFYAENVPVFFITTGVHTDYHTPFDDADKINYPALRTLTDFVCQLTLDLANQPEKLTFRKTGFTDNSVSAPRLKVTLGFMPDFSNTDIQGVRVELVTKGKPADLGGIKKGDIITAINGQPVSNVYDYMYRLSKLTRNQTISVEILRDNKKQVLMIQL